MEDNSWDDSRIDYLRVMEYESLVLILNENKECLKSTNFSAHSKFYASIFFKALVFLFILFPLAFSESKQGLKELWIILLCTLLIFIYSIKEFKLHSSGIDANHLMKTARGNFESKQGAIILLILFYDDICVYNDFKAKRKNVFSMISCALSITGIMLYTIYIIIDK